MASNYSKYQEGSGSACEGKTTDSQWQMSANKPKLEKTYKKIPVGV